MQKIGNIIGKLKISLDGMFIKTASVENADNNLPVLYVGIENARSHIEKFSLFKEIYDNDIFWTPSKTEKRDVFIERCDKFIRYCLDKATSKVSYEYVNITCYGYNRLKKLLNYAKSKDTKYCFLTRGSRFVFFYSPKYNIVWGLSLSLCEYVGINKSKILNIIGKNRNNLIINDLTNKNDEFYELRKLIGDNTHLIPIVYYLTIS